MAKVPKALLAWKNGHQFSEREIPLNAPAKIGRAVAGCKPNVDNGYFNCKVLSRNHAVLFYENGKFFLQDTQSSNGTFINGQKLPTSGGSGSGNSPQGTLKGEQDLKREVFSGDVLQFGVEVVEPARKGQPPVTHGCIIAAVRLFHPDGSEQRGQSTTGQDGTRTDTDAGQISEAPKISEQELYQLQSILQEACHRENMLESKLVMLNRLFSSLERKDLWNSAFQEDFLLAKINYLQGKLNCYESKMGEIGSSNAITQPEAGVKTETSSGIGSISPDAEHLDNDDTFQDRARDINLVSDDHKVALIAEWKNMLEERANFENVARDALHRALAEKMEISQALALAEERLYLAQAECGELNSLCQTTQKELIHLVEKFHQQSELLDELTKSCKDAEQVKIQCLEAISREKDSASEKLSEFHQALQEERLKSDELEKENSALRVKLYSLMNGNHQPVVNGNREEDEEETETSVRRESYDASSDNMFKGKSVAELVKQMLDEDDDSDIEDSPAELDMFLQAQTSLRSGFEGRMNAKGTSDSTKETGAKMDEAGNENLLSELQNLREERQKLEALLTDVRAQLEQEQLSRKRYQLMEQNNFSTIDSETSALSVKEETDFDGSQGLSLKDGFGLSANSWAEIDNSSFLIFGLVVVWMLAMAVLGLVD